MPGARAQLRRRLLRHARPRLRGFLRHRLLHDGPAVGGPPLAHPRHDAAGGPCRPDRGGLHRDADAPVAQRLPRRHHARLRRDHPEHRQQPQPDGRAGGHLRDRALEVGRACRHQYDRLLQRLPGARRALRRDQLAGAPFPPRAGLAGDPRRRGHGPGDGHQGTPLQALRLHGGQCLRLHHGLFVRGRFRRHCASRASVSASPCSSSWRSP